MAGLASGKSVVLSNNSSESLTKSTNGGFEFKTKVEKGKAYNVTVATQPTGQSCTVTNGSGTATGAVTNIKVQCTDVATGSGGMAACFDNPQLLKAGNSYTIVSPDETSQFQINGLTSYRGHEAVQIRIQTSRGVTGNSYVNLVNGMQWSYGYVMSVPQQFETYFSPGIGFPISLNINETHTSPYNHVTVIPGSADYTVAATQTVTYLGRESVTTGFGTFDTCKIRFTGSGADGKVTTWYNWIVGSGKLAGFAVQQTSDNGTSQPSNITVSWN